MNKFILAWAEDSEIRQNGQCGGFVTAILKFMVENKYVDYALAVKRGKKLEYSLCLTSDPDEILKLSGNVPYATPNIANFIRKYVDTQNNKIAVVCKPCDARAIIELAKRNQINIDNVFMIGLNCSGTFLPSTFKKTLESMNVQPGKIKLGIKKDELVIFSKDGIIKANLEELEKKGLGRRENCRRCEVKIPRMCDLACGKWGVPEGRKDTFVEICSDRGEKVVMDAKEAGVINFEDASDESIKIRENIEKFALNMSKKWQEYYFGQMSSMSYEEKRDFWFKMFERCIKCYACRDVCPICYCEDCILNPWQSFIKGGEIPPSPEFSITRIIHVAQFCLNCGQCQDVCPAEIPLARIAHKLNKEVQKMWNYMPGMDLNDDFWKTILEPLEG